jgi:inosine-uridine nucleoside N-ribohydrolase
LADGTRRILIDTDPGIGTPRADVDDGIAILLALCSPVLDIAGITTVKGNTDVHSGTANVLRLLRDAGRTEIPVAKGCSRPIGREVPEIVERRLSWIPPAAEDAAFRTSERGVDFMIDTVMGSPSKTTIVAMGPLTNVALAMIEEPGVCNFIDEIVVMGGSIYASGTRPRVEFNILNDPEAADIVFESGVPITLIPLDVTTSVRFRKETIKPWAEADSPLIRRVHDLTVDWMEYRYIVRGEEDVGCYFHDAMNVAYLVDPDMFISVDARIVVELRGEHTRGQTVVHMGASEAGHPISKVLVGVDRARFTRMVVDEIATQFR